MSKYLYGASVQGIQGFIFETNKLREIAGASELVERICTGLFQDFFKKLEINYEAENVLIAAAGNIKYFFENETDCKKVYKFFPQEVMNIAPGITISQAVVEIPKNIKRSDINELENRLKVQRNLIYPGVDQPQMATERSRNTAKAGVQFASDRNKGSKAIDAAQEKKRDVTKSNSPLMAKLTGIKPYPMKDTLRDVDSFTKGLHGDKNWIAVVHADGNSLGRVIQQLAKKLDKHEGEILKAAFKDFSNELDKSTIAAAQKAYSIINEKFKLPESKPPVRPVVIGGDDLTIILRGDLALDFTYEFLKAFSDQTKINFEGLVEKYELDILKDGLTACAGIAYVKPSYPFHYAVSLAEDLCSTAKKKSKDMDPEHAPASLNFHKVQSSFVESFDEIQKRELKCGKEDMYLGPYFVDENKDRNIKRLIKYIRTINQKEAPKGALRNWLNEIHHDTESANQLMHRIKIIHKSYYEKLGLQASSWRDNLHIHDVIALSSIMKKD